MLISVTERTQEIGCAPKLGARPRRRAIAKFLLEAVVLTLVGGHRHSDRRRGSATCATLIPLDFPQRSLIFGSPIGFAHLRRCRTVLWTIPRTSRRTSTPFLPPLRMNMK